jgi:peptidoglycan/xylan/chitin deacetylase (PgdA/CDA1 family)
MEMIVPKDHFILSHGAVIRGQRDRKEMALVFTGGDFGEGSHEVLDTLQKEGVQGAFFFTGDYLKKEEHRAVVRRAVAEGHYVGPHSHGHLLYCPWDDRERTLVTREEFAADLRWNVEELVALGVSRDGISWWIPPYEWYNVEIARWAEVEGFRLFNFTPGTLSHADYTEETAGNYRSSREIFDSILAFEEKDPDGLNGFLLLSHVGAGAGRPDKFFRLLPEVIVKLRERGYRFLRVDELLGAEV